MIVDIDKIIVKNRIRKDYGDITELAEDIRKNGLINPPAISRNYELIAGERRLRACKSLGWKQIEVHQMDVDDAEKQLYMEISENETRKDFSMTERLDYARRLARVESAKAKERMSEGGKGRQNSDNLRTDDVVAEKTGIGSRDTYRKASFIADNRDMVSPEDFANWDDGKLSTNKLYNQIKQQKHDLAVENQALKEAHQKLVQKNARLQSELDDREPEVRVVEKRVVPDDYEYLKKELSDSKRSEMLVAQERQKYLNELRAAKAKINEFETRNGEKDWQKKLEMEAEFFTNYVNDFVQKMGGYVWVADSVDKLPESKRKSFVQSVINIDGWAQAMIRNMGGTINERKE